MDEQNRSQLKTDPIRRWLWLVTALLTAVLVIGRSLVPAADGLDARYFVTEQTEGVPTHVVVDRAPSTEQVRARWGASRPDVFSVAWTGYLLIVSPGTFARNLRVCAVLGRQLANVHRRATDREQRRPTRARDTSR